jgi:putative Mn2+ efflux pump MntP
MSILTLLLTSLGLAMDAFAVSVSNSMCYKNENKKTALLTSFAFGAFQGAMPLIGFFAGSLFSKYIKTFDHWIALLVLSFIGGKMIIDAIKEMREIKTVESCPLLTFKLILLQAVGTSIDAMAVGIGFAALGESGLFVNIFVTCLIIALVTFLCCTVAHLIGKKAGEMLKEKAQIFGGAILIIIGLKIFIEHMFM